MAPAKKQVVPTQKAGNPATAMIPWEEQMAKDAEVAAAMTGAASGTFISIKGGVVTIDKVPVSPVMMRLPGNVVDVPVSRIEAVVVAHVFENVYYEGKYDENTPVPPKCFAFGTVDSSESSSPMAPHPLSTEPQNPTCYGCWANEWASADTGRGKACKNIRRLAIIAGDEDSIADAETIANQKVHYLKVPVTSVKAWDGHVKAVANTLRRPPLGVVTYISAAPDTKTQLRVDFSVARKIETGEQYEALSKVGKFQQEEGILFPYQPASEREEPAKPVRNQKFRGAPTPAKSVPAKKVIARR